MSVIDFFKPTPPPGVTGQEKIKHQYNYWRIRIFYSMYFGYVFYYFSRKAFTFAIPQMINELGFDKADVGKLGTILSLVYGMSKFMSGIISDRSNPRYIMSIGLIVTGLLNLLFGMSSTLMTFQLICAANGFFQGWGWPPCARLLTHWYSQEERGRWWSFWNTSHNIGGALIPILVAVVINFIDWRFAMYIPGVLCVIVGCWMINRLRDTPESLGLPSIEEFKEESVSYQRKGTSGDEGSSKEHLSTRDILFKYVLNNPFIWLLAVAYFFIYVIRTAINDWTMPFLIAEKGFKNIHAGAGVAFFEIGGLIGALTAGWVSDKLLSGMRGPINVLYSLFAMFSVAGLLYLPFQNHWIAYGLLFTIGFFIFGPQMMIGIAAAELSHKKAAGSATGFAGWFAYLGAASAGWPFGAIADQYGWNGIFVALFFCGIIATFLLIPLWSVGTSRTAVESTS